MSRKKSGRKRRQYSDELKEEAVQMVLDGHSAESVASNLGLSGQPGLPLEGESPGDSWAGGDTIGDSGMSIGGGVASRGAGA